MDEKRRVQGQELHLWGAQEGISVLRPAKFKVWGLIGRAHTGGTGNC